MFLKSQQIIDYSLLLGLHFRAPDHLTTLLEPPTATSNTENQPADDGIHIFIFVLLFAFVVFVSDLFQHYLILFYFYLNISQLVNI